MKIILSVLASALLLTYLIVQTFTVFWPNNLIALFFSAFLALTINGAFIYFQSAAASRKTSENPSNSRPRQNRERRPNNQPSRNESKQNRKPEYRLADSQTAPGNLEGTIKWFNRRKGYGFILEDSGEEIFFHQREIAATNGESADIDKGQKVRFSRSETDKGPQAQGVSKIN